MSDRAIIGRICLLLAAYGVGCWCVVEGAVAGGCAVLLLGALASWQTARELGR